MSGFAFRPPPGPRPDTGLLDWLVQRQGRTRGASICGGVATGQLWAGLPITEIISNSPLGNKVSVATDAASITGFSVETDSNVAAQPFQVSITGDNVEWITPAPSAIANMTVCFVRMRSGAMVSVPCDASGVRPFQPVTWDFGTNQLVPASPLETAVPVTVLAVSQASVIQLVMSMFVAWSPAAHGVAVILI